MIFIFEQLLRQNFRYGRMPWQSENQKQKYYK